MKLEKAHQRPHQSQRERQRIHVLTLLYRNIAFKLGDAVGEQQDARADEK